MKAWFEFSEKAQEQTDPEHSTPRSVCGRAPNFGSSHLNYAGAITVGLARSCSKDNTSGLAGQRPRAFLRFCHNQDSEVGIQYMIHAVRRCE